MIKAKKILAGALSAAMVLTSAGVTTLSSTVMAYADPVANPVAVVGEEYYETLQEAFDAVPNNGTITLVNDVIWGDDAGEEGEVVCVNRNVTGRTFGKNVTLDLAGYTIENKTDNAVIDGPCYVYYRGTGWGAQTTSWRNEGSITIKGTGAIVAAEGQNAIIAYVRQNQGAPNSAAVTIIGDVYTYGGLDIGATVRLSVQNGTYSESPVAYMQNGLGWVNNNGTYCVGEVSPVWTWTDPAAEGAPPTAAITLELPAYGLYVTDGAVAATVEDPVVVPATCTEAGYTLYEATYDSRALVSDISGVKGTVIFSTDDSEENYIIPGDPATGHAYEATEIRADSSAGVPVYVDGNRKYYATLTCEHCGKILSVTGTVSMTAGTTTSFTDGEGQVWQTKTTAILNNATCIAEGTTLTPEFDILDGEGNTLVKDIIDGQFTIEGESPKTDHVYSLDEKTHGILKAPFMVWVVDGDEVAQLETVSEESSYAYRVYTPCQYEEDDTHPELVQEQAVTISKTAPTYKVNEAGQAVGVDGALTIDSQTYAYTYIDENGNVAKAQAAPLGGATQAIPATAVDAQYGTVFVQGISISWDTYKTVRAATCGTPGVVEGTITGATGTYYQYTATTAHDWKFVEHVNATADDAGFDVYKCSLVTPAQILWSYNGLTSPAVFDEEEGVYVVGTPDGSDCIDPAKGYSYVIAKKPDGTDNVSLDEKDDKLTVNLLEVDNATHQYVDPDDPIEVVYFVTEDGDLTKTDAAELPCTSFVTYNLDDEDWGITYSIQGTTRGQIHPSWTGAVSWSEDGTGTPSVSKVTCTACGQEETKAAYTKVESVKGEPVKATCTEDGYVPYIAVYTGELENVELTNKEFHSVTADDKAKGHVYTRDGAKPKFEVSENLDGTYSAAVYCYAEEAYVDTVTKVEGPFTLTDESRQIKVTYTDGIGNTLPTATLTLMDKAQTVLDGKDDLLWYTVTYGKYTNADIATVVKSVTNENDKPITADNYEVVVLDETLNPVNPPEEGQEPTALPVGFYLVRATGVGSYAGMSGAILRVADADPEYSFIPDSDTLSPNYNGTVWTGYYDIAGTKPAHTLTATATEDGVAITYSVNGGEATAEAPIFTEVGNYEVVVTGKKANYADYTEVFTVHVWKTEVYVWVDNATTTYGVDPTVNYRLTYTDEDQTPFADESVLGLEITTIAGEPITDLDAGTYVLSAKFDNENYRPYVRGGIYQSQAPTLNVEKANLSDATITLDPKSYVYDGKTKKPTETVTYKGMTLVKGVDYKIAYTNNKNAGTAKAVITGKEGNFTGTKSASFKITKAANTLKIAGATRSVDLAKVTKKAVTVSGVKVKTKGKGTMTYKKVKVNKKSANFKVDSKTGKITVKKGTAKGTYKVTVKAKAAGTSNYKASSWLQKVVKIVIK